MSFLLQVRSQVPDIPPEGRSTKADGAVASDPYEMQKSGFWGDESAEADDLSIPQRPQLLRCNAVHCVERGPWTGTLVCCLRKAGHPDRHQVVLGDVGTSEFWQETWR